MEESLYSSLLSSRCCPKCLRFPLLSLMKFVGLTDRKLWNYMRRIYKRNFHETNFYSSPVLFSIAAILCVVFLQVKRKPGKENADLLAEEGEQEEGGIWDSLSK